MESAEDGLIRDVVHTTKGVIRDAMPGVWNEQVEKDIGCIFTSACELVRLLHRQQATFRVEMMSAIRDEQGVCINSDTIEEVLPSPTEVDGEIIEVSVFPGMYKVSDGAGKNVRCA